jgi:hypothetical protein
MSILWMQHLILLDRISRIFRINRIVLIFFRFG